MAIHVGIGSWADNEYVGLLYPKKLPREARLRTYAEWFDRVEVNLGYHRPLTRAETERWANETPPAFRFDVKLFRAFSENPAAAAQNQDLVAKTLEAAEPLQKAGKFGVFMMTLPPSFGPERRRLEELDGLGEKLRPHALAVELRHAGWVKGEARATTLDYFRRRGLVWIAVDVPQLKSTALLPPIDEVTHPHFAYLRLHGRNPDYLKATDASEKHRYDYTDADLREIVSRIEVLAARATDVHVSLNNHAENFAPKAALALRRLLGQPVPPDLRPEPVRERPSAKADDGQLAMF